MSQLTVKKLALHAQVSNDTVRHYVRIGLLKPSRNPDNNYKLFSLEDIKRVKFIRRAQQIGFSLSEIGQLLHDAEQGQSPCPIARDIIKAKIEENKKTINELVKLQLRMEAALNQWNNMPNKTPDGETICNLIEHWDE